MRMSPDRFEYLLSLVAPLITKKDTRMRKAIGPAERLSLTLHYLAYGDSQQSNSFAYRIGRSAVSKIIRETCDAIWAVLHEEYLKPRSSSQEWKEIAHEFQRLWNFPHCVGAINGKHVAIQCPLNSGSLYHNYKGFFSIVLLAVCEAHYSFTSVDIGNYGSNNDSGVLSHSTMGQALEAEQLNLPKPETLEGWGDHNFPYFLIGDEAVALKQWMQRPISGRELPEDQRIFNYRLSRARRVIENPFGILAARWHIFHRPIQGSVGTVQSITQAAVCLHNYLRQTNNACYCPIGFVDNEDSTGQIRPGEWRRIVKEGCNGALRPLCRPRGSRYQQSAVAIRENLKEYVNSPEGALSWQWDYVRCKGPRH